ncbi:MAG: DUF393 domain-containing protein [Planctomycetota bacterium]
MASKKLELADPRDKPEADIVVWDGKCDFCRAQVERLSRYDSEGILAYMSLHDSRIYQVCPELTYDQLMAQMWVCTHEGSQHGGADAIRYLASKLPSLWWLRPFMAVPGAMIVMRWLYGIVAKRRYAISGRKCDDGSCELH